MLPPHPANLKGAPPVIKGVVLSTAYTVLGPRMKGYTNKVPLDKYPYQINNMNAWLMVIMEYGEHPDDLQLAYKVYWRDIKYLVNDGKGRKKGVGSNVNTFTYYIGGEHEWRIDLIIITKAHQQYYHEKVRAGQHVRQPKLYKIKPPMYLDATGGVTQMKVPVWQPDDNGWRYESMTQDEFIARHFDFSHYEIQYVQPKEGAD